MSLGRRKVKGQRGQWYATVDGERLACLHAHWVKGACYEDAHKQPGVPRDDAMVAALRAAGRFILTSDDVADEGTSLTRTGYIAIFSATDIEFDAEGLRLTIGGPREDLH